MLAPAAVLLLVLFGFQASIEACSPRQTDDGFICVCNSTYCDKVPEIGQITEGGLKVFWTSNQEPGFNVKEITFSDEQTSDVVVVTVTEEKSQKIIGFGGAFTDAASINIKSLPEDAQKLLLESYFGEDGIEYNICRVPLGACDFSPRQYTLDDTEDNADDPDLSNFQLQPEDLEYKIPVMQQAFEIRGDKPLNLFASAWTAPLWMKDKQIWFGGSELKKENYQVWADYHIKFFDAYLEKGIKFWGLTIGNEPSTGFAESNPIPSMGWDTASQADYIANHLGPTIRNHSDHKELKIIIHDENLSVLPFLVTPLLNDDRTLQYIDGVGVHWYTDGSVARDTKYLARSDKKDVFALNTEACHFITQPILGSWDRINSYLDNIITDLEWGYNGWVEWNLALSHDGGPTHINWPADAPIIVSEDQKEFYKQPIFYGLGHFSKFVVPDSVRLGVDNPGSGVRIVAFLRPDNLKAVVMLNSNTDPMTIQIADQGKYVPIELPALSISTMLYQNSEE